MHFVGLYLVKNETLDTIDLDEVQDEFYKRWCDGCGENRPMYRYICDWFTIGGRWVDKLKAIRGKHGSPAWTITDFEPKEGNYSVVEIKDLTEPIIVNQIYYFITKSTVTSDKEKIQKHLDKINAKKINGVLIQFDLHD